MTYTDSRCFIDTNVFVYAFNRIDKNKTNIARKLLKSLAKNANGIVSEQVLLELFNVITNKLKIERSESRKIVSKLTRFEMVYSGQHNFRNSIDLAVLGKISIWDAHIISSAINAGAKYLLSEDMQEGQDFHGVIIKNPFKS